MTAKSRPECPRVEIAAYVDGELAGDDELGLELHLAECVVCRAYLNDQKRLLFALDDALDASPEIVIPANFARVVAANAKSKVAGLRCPVERNRALFVFLALGLLVLFGLGAESATSLGVVGALAERGIAVAAFFGHLFLDLAVATAVIIRSVCLQFVYASAVSIGLLIVAGAVATFVITRNIRQNRF